MRVPESLIEPEWICIPRLRGQFKELKKQHDHVAEHVTDRHLYFVQYNFVLDVGPLGSRNKGKYPNMFLSIAKHQGIERSTKNTGVV